jgi:lipid-A-disaccharide synthase
MPSGESPSLLIVAAEASSALYAQRLLEHWQAGGRAVEAFGIGSRDMERLGFRTLARSEEMAVVGLVEVLSHFRAIRSAFHRIVEEAKQRRPKVALLLDYPGFNLRLARKLKALGIPVVYYVSPQVWAWKQSRVKTIRACVDRMLVVLPFEQAFYEAHGVPVEFVGHPLLDEIGGKLLDPERVAGLRMAAGLAAEDLVLALMPGSRRSELDHHLDIQVEAARLLVERRPELRVVLLVAPSLDAAEVRRRLGAPRLAVNVIKDEPFAMIALADVVLCASGTATLMVGLMGKPMAIMYRLSRVTVWLARLIMQRPARFGLINLVLDEDVAPEFLQDEANPDALARALAPLIDSRRQRDAMRDRLLRARRVLGERGATKRVADALEPYLAGKGELDV